MIFRNAMFALFLFWFGIAFAQEKSSKMIPDYKTVKQQSTDKASGFYYPRLYARWAANDSSLTDKEVHMLYYGKFYNTPRGVSSFNKKKYVDSLFAIYDKGRANITEDDMNALLRYYLEEHRCDPYRLKTLNAIYNILKGLHDPKAANFAWKMLKVCNVIMLTGDGFSKESAFHVNCVSDEYAMVALLHLSPGEKQSVTGNKYDYLEVKENQRDIPGLYFNVEQIFEEYGKLLGTDDFINVTNRNRP